MAKINFNLLGDHDRGMASVVQELEVMGLEMVAIASDILDQNEKNMDGTLKQTLNHEVAVFMNEVATLIFGGNADHLPYIEFGTVPHWPPLEPIAYWVRQKINPPYEEIKTIAYLVARKISKEGTEPFPVIDMTLKEMIPVFAERCEAAYELGFNKLF